jgi:hypothetical protein
VPLIRPRTRSLSRWEGFEGLAAAHHHQEFARCQGVRRRGVEGEPVGRTGRQHGDAAVAAEVEIPQGPAHESAGHGDFLDAVAVVEAQPLQEIGSHQFATEAQALHARGKHHPVGSDPLQHLFVQVAGGPGDHLAHPAAVAVLHDQGGGDAGLKGFADGHHNRVYIEGPGSPEGLLVGAVHHPGLQGGIQLPEFIDGPLAGVDGQDLRPGPQ